MDNGVTTSSSTVVIGLLAAALAGGLLTGFVSYTKSQRARRRRIIAEAVEIAFDRVEIVYKLLRRPTDPVLLARDELDIRNEMHRIQSKTEYYIAILSSESVWLGACYEKLIDEIKLQTKPVLQKVWQQKPKGVDVKLEQTIQINLTSARNEFILDTQRYFNPIRRIWFSLTYRMWRSIHRG